MRFIYMHFAFLGPESQSAGEASECAADQNAFWEYHDKLYASQNGENQNTFSKENLVKFAADLGLDIDVFNNCLETGKYADIVQQETELARQIGVSSTPAFIINGKAVIGSQPFESFQQFIEAALVPLEQTTP